MKSWKFLGALKAGGKTGKAQTWVWDFIRDYFENLIRATENEERSKLREM